MSDAELLTNVRDGIARITFNRPAVRNALTQAMVLQMTDFLRGCEHRDDVRVILLTGAGAHFMAGGDIKGFAAAAASPAGERRARFEALALDNLPLFTVLDRIEKPVVVSIRGACAGVSMGYAAAADFVLASDNAMFVVANVALGVCPDGGTTWSLPRLLGERVARRMCLLGERLTAAQALACDLVDWVHPDDALDAATETLLRRIADGPAVAIRETKRLLAAARNADLVTHLALEARSAGICGASDDFAEGIAAFAEKRAPSFTGR